MQKILYRSLKDSKIHSSKKNRRGIWIRVKDPTEVELQDLIKDYDLDPYAYRGNFSGGNYDIEKQNCLCNF